MLIDQWLVNGAYASSIPADDRGLAYGDGLFETMRWTGRSIPLLESHIKRLQQGCSRLSIDLDIARLRRDISSVLDSLGSGQFVIKLILSRGGRATGYRPDKFLDMPNEINIYIRQQPLNTTDVPDLSLGAQICELRLSHQPHLAGIKHLNRLEQVLAANEIDDPRQEGLLLDSGNRLIEAISSNLILVADGTLYMPDLSLCGVEGIMSRVLASLSRQEGICVETKHLTLEDLIQSDEVLVCNAVRGVRNLAEVKGYWASESRRFGDMLRTLVQTQLGQDFYSF